MAGWRTAKPERRMQTTAGLPYRKTLISHQYSAVLARCGKVVE
jgi:hypothetical protein